MGTAAAKVKLVIVGRQPRGTERWWTWGQCQGRVIIARVRANSGLAVQHALEKDFLEHFYLTSSRHEPGCKPRIGVKDILQASKFKCWLRI